MTSTDSLLADRIRELATSWASSQHALVTLAADFADSHHWALDGSPSAAHWIAVVADIEVSTAREWIRIGRALRTLHASADAYADGLLSYSKIRTLTRVATEDNELELLDIALEVPAGELGRALAAWRARNNPEDVDKLHQQQRSVKWRVEPDGMVTFTLRLPPPVAALLIAWLTQWVMKSRPDASADAYPSVAQQHADAIAALFESVSSHEIEVVLHVRGDGCTLDDGTPITESAVAKAIPEAFVRALIHDAESNPLNASGRQRHPTTKQKRLVKERDQVCIDCGRTDLLEFDHNPAYEDTKHTLVEELELRCAPCHRARHKAA
ncbi:MAG: DUF222 domain-containing protein [Acidimicrobiales bacterium]|nr:DUF222 domain-containing protein [Acidimicrobiales bacterium]